MTAQEQQMLQGLTERIGKTDLSEKDPEAEQYLQQTLGRNPDALYILAQTVLVQQYALEQATKQMADLKAQVEQMRQQPPAPVKHTSFLGSLLGHDDPPPPPPVAQQAPLQGQYMQVPQQYAQPQYAQQYAPPPAYPPQYGQGGFGAPQQGGFLRSAMQTATGVAAGALAFEGIESLMHGFGGHGGGYGFGGGGGSRPEEIINNNYYGDASPGHEHGREFSDQNQQLSPDIEDRRGESRFSQAAEANDHGYANDPGNDDANTDSFAGDTAGSDDSTSDDSASYDTGSDDSGSDDSGSDQGSSDGGF